MGNGTRPGGVLLKKEALLRDLRVGGDSKKEACASLEKHYPNLKRNEQTRKGGLSACDSPTDQ